MNSAPLQVSEASGTERTAQSNKIACPIRITEGSAVAFSGPPTHGWPIL
jgi:hypothetical protein